MVEAGHVSHDGLLIWPQSAYNICTERERKRERKAGESDSCREGTGAGPEAHAGGRALTPDWKPNPGYGSVGAFHQGSIEAKGEVRTGGSLF